MTIGDRLNDAIGRAGFRSQNDLARASGVPQPTISRILKGVGTKGPETETLRKLAAACGVTFDWLNEGIEPTGLPRGQISSTHDPKVQLVDPNVDLGPTADEIIDLITAFRRSPKKHRASILNSAKNASALSPTRRTANDPK
jgi:transcriptional regulator with XRE-family HTH domain